MVADPTGTTASSPPPAPNTLSHVVTALGHLWPVSGAEEWDTPGLVTGNPDQPVQSILLAVDAVDATVVQAVEAKIDLLVTHHPLLMRGVSSVAEERYKGSLIARLIRNNTALLAAHTNADVVATGTSAVMADLLGVMSAIPLTASPQNVNGTDTGLGRVGDLADSMTLGDFARRVAQTLPATAQGIRVSGDYGQQVQRIALCAGAGDSLLAHPLVTTADVYITSDLRHHAAQESREQSALGGGPALIDVSHWAAEWLWLEYAAREIRAVLPGVDVSVSDIRTDPWDFVIVQ
jgi:dinuclear metal center YbgI/SA1388 family protein